MGWGAYGSDDDAPEKAAEEQRQESEQKRNKRCFVALTALQRFFCEKAVKQALSDEDRYLLGIINKALK